MRPAVYECVRRELFDEGESIARSVYPERAGNRVVDSVELCVPVERAILVGADRLIYDVFRDPAFPGTGKALIQRALHSGPLTLVVTDGNPAERLYRRLGFVHTYEAYSARIHR